MATASADVLARTLKKSAHLERHFFTGMAISMLAVALVGFLPSLIQTSERRAPVSPLVAVHGLLFFAWLVIFLIQSRLIVAERISMHRRLGIAAGFVFVVMVSLSFAATVVMVRRGFDLSGDLMRTVPPKLGPDVLWESIFQFGDLLLFTTLATASFLYRRRPEIHARKQCRDALHILSLDSSGEGSPGDVPLLVRDISTSEIYVFDVDFP